MIVEDITERKATRGAAGPPLDARPADRPGQPAAVPGPAVARPRAGPPGAHPHLRADHRPRRLQEDQRRARPPDGRPRARLLRRAAALGAAGQRHRGPPGRRRVQHRLREHRDRRRRGARGPAADDRSPSRWSWASSRSRSASASASGACPAARSPAGSTSGSSGRPTTPCTRTRPPGAADRRRQLGRAAAQSRTTGSQEKIAVRRGQDERDDHEHREPVQAVGAVDGDRAGQQGQEEHRDGGERRAEEQGRRAAVLAGGRPGDHARRRTAARGRAAARRCRPRRAAGR